MSCRRKYLANCLMKKIKLIMDAKIKTTTAIAAASGSIDLVTAATNMNTAAPSMISLHTIGGKAPVRAGTNTQSTEAKVPATIPNPTGTRARVALEHRYNRRRGKFPNA